MPDLNSLLKEAGNRGLDLGAPDDSGQGASLPDLMAEKQAREQQQQSQAPVPQQSFAAALKDSAAAYPGRVAADPQAYAMGTIRGVEKAFEPPSEIFGIKTGIPDNLVEKVEGTLAFPVIRGAELAASMFVPHDMRPEFTTWKDAVDQQIQLTEALKQRAPGVVEGSELGTAAASLPALVETLGSTLKNAGRIAPRAWQAINDWRAGQKASQATNLAKTLMKEGKGPVLDAIVDRPDEVLKLIKNDATAVDDLAVETGQQLLRIEDELGKNVGKYRRNFIADPTKKVGVAAPVQLMDGTISASPQDLIKGFRASTTTDNGVSVLNSKQQGQLDFLEKILNPEPKIRKESFDVVDKTIMDPITSISPKDALLALDKIDEMTSMKEIQNGNISAAAVNNLLEIRRALKTQIRGNNADWARADQVFSNYKDDALNLVGKFNSDSRESFVNNLFGAGKSPIRDRLRKVLDYADYVDTKTSGSGDAFFRRLANIKAAQKYQNVQMELSDPIQDKLNHIVRFWTRVGENSGATVGSGVGGLTGNMFNTGGAIAGGFGGMNAGKLAGGVLGYKVGKMMANPQRVLNAAMAAKELSGSAKQLASDLSYVHKVFGNDGVVSLMDVVGSTPAANELLKFTRNKAGGDDNMVHGLPGEVDMSAIK